MKMPWCKFYPRDWMGDAELRSLDYAARGLWVDILCLMASSARPGFLIVGGRSLSPEDLARQTGGEPEEVRHLLNQLESAGVFSRNPSGVIYSRRLLREYRESEQKRASGRQGGNPALKHAVKRPGGSNARVSDKPIFQKPEDTTTTPGACNPGERTKPFSLADVHAVLAEEGRAELAQEFFDYNQARGWEKTRDLPAMARLYIRRHEERKPKKKPGADNSSHDAKHALQIPFADGCQPREQGK